MPEPTPPWSPKQIRRSQAALDGFLTPDVRAALAEGLRAVGDPKSPRTGLEAVLERHGIDLPAGISITYPFGPPPVDPPSLPPIVIGNPQPFRRCLTICHHIGPTNPQSPDPTRLTICYTLCI